MLVLVGRSVPVSGSVVNTSAKLVVVLCTVPWVCTNAAPGGLFTVASYLMVTVLPIGRVPTPIGPTVSPDRGVTSFFCGAMIFTLASALDEILSAWITVGVTGVSLLLGNFNSLAKPATGVTMLRTDAN